MTQENSYQKKETSQTSNSGTTKSTIPTSSNEEESDPETEGESQHHYISEPTKWSYPNSEITDPVYVRDSDSKSEFQPLPRVESDYRIGVDTRIEEHFIGILTSDEVNLKVNATLLRCEVSGPNEDALVLTKSTARIHTRFLLAAASVKPDDFALYYRKDRNYDVGSAIQLYLAHRNTRDEVFHFPVLRCSEDNGSKWWHVQIGNNKMQSFRQLSDLVRCYHLYRFTDARTGRMEVFPLWQGGIVDDYE